MENKDLKVVTVMYEVYSDFFIEDIINNYNSINGTKYTNDDIDDYNIKYNILTLKLKDGNTIMHSQEINDDFKHYDELKENDQDILNNNYNNN